MAAKIVHVEVVGKDGPALQKFYGDVFGWSFDTNNPQGYGMFRDDGAVSGGVGPTREGEPGHVTFYVHSEDPAEVLRRVEERGGRVIMPLTEVAPETTVALFADPEGHIVGLM